MRCDVVREMFEEGVGTQPDVQSHLASCAACSEYAREWESICEGFARLRKEEPPEPSFGFAMRVVHQLERNARKTPWGPQFLVQAGKRVVFATLLVAFLFLLALILPSSGPVRSAGVSESVLSQPEVAALSNDQILNDQSLGVDASDFSSPAANGPDLQEIEGTK